MTFVDLRSCSTAQPLEHPSRLFCLRLPHGLAPFLMLCYGCAGARNKGAAVCTNRATIGRAEVEERVLSGLKQRLLAPDLLAQFAEEYRKAFNDAAAGPARTGRRPNTPSKRSRTGSPTS
ncbi:hypothetical protein [Leisingera sp. NJS201]|uniref:hypothetical protein n=1 Tax=Leisingera sp. NJS201 TaxID=2508306 RepID=UPI0020C755A6|nr:hypothetical protein [Leisingera sp. NJS201]